MQTTDWLIMALVLVFVALWGAFVLWRSRRLPPPPVELPRGEYETRYPVLLVHGLLGFDELRVGSQTHEYFRGVLSHLLELGTEVHRPRLPPLRGIRNRAEKLAAFIKAMESPKVNIIAHSLGGLDARYAISELGVGSRVASLITIGTPHHGTPVADAGMGVLTKLGLRKICERLKLDIRVFDDLTTEHMQAFNDEVQDISGVFYGSVVGKAGKPFMPHALLAPTYMFLFAKAGANDGLVPAESQRWGETLLEVDADHWAEVGWSAAFNANALYQELVAQLVSRGC